MGEQGDSSGVECGRTGRRKEAGKLEVRNGVSMEVIAAYRSDSVPMRRTGEGAYLDL